MPLAKFPASISAVCLLTERILQVDILQNAFWQVVACKLGCCTRHFKELYNKIDIWQHAELNKAEGIMAIMRLQNSI